MATNTSAKKRRTGREKASRARSPEVMTLAETAKFLRLTEPVVQRLALHGRIPGRVAEGEWRFLRSALLIWLAGTDFREPLPAPPAAPHLSSKERLLAVAGSLADDDTLEAMVEEIYRQRKRHPVGG